MIELRFADAPAHFTAITLIARRSTLKIYITAASTLL
jgi:hypothetical protein